MVLPKLLYIQKFQVHEHLVDLYQQFVMKLVEAHKKKGNANIWDVYENTFSTIESTREFIFMREMNSWSKLDDMSSEESLAKLLISAFGEKEGLQILDIGKRSTKSITTEVLSKIDMMSI